MTLRSLVLPCVLLLALSSAAEAGNPARLRVRTFASAAYAGERLRTDPRELPRGVTGVLPAIDGDPFALSIDPGTYSGRSEEEVRRALEDLLPLVGYTGSVRDLELVDETRLGPADPAFVEEEGRADLERLEERLSRRFGEISEVTEEALRYQMDEQNALFNRMLRVQRYDLTLDGVAVDGLGLSVELDEDGQILSLSGALSNAGRLSNEARLSSEKAANLATHALEEQTRIRSVGDPESGAIASGEKVIAVWTVDVETTDGPYRMTLDADSGEVLSLAFNADLFASAQGATFDPDPFSGPGLSFFEVDDAQNGKFNLNLNGTRTVLTDGEDGCAAPVTVPQGNGTANFDVAPVNVTNVKVASDPGYNCHFQEVNVAGVVSETLDRFYALGATEVWPMDITVDGSFVCGLGINNSCAPGGDLQFGIGTGTRDGGNTANDLYNTAVDSTVVVHELGHVVSHKQSMVGGSKMTSSEAEGLSDFWADAMLDTDTNGAWTAQNQGGPTETGYWPRQATGMDVFPEHLHLNGGNTEVHANGEMLTWALWNVRRELDDRVPNGRNFAVNLVLTALTHANMNVDQNITDKNIYNSYQGLMRAMLQDAETGLTRLDVVQGFARAGIYAGDSEVVIDIDQDYLSKNDQPPTFTVWVGPDFSFDASGTASDITPAHPLYQVEVANDAGFTANHTFSPVQSNLAEDAGGNTWGSWQLPQNTWDKLGHGSLIYYRVTAWDPYLQDPITSETTEGGMMTVPTATAVVTDGGINGCSTAGGRPGLLGALLGLALALRRRA